MSGKPTLDLYVGQHVSGISRGKLPWQWGISLSGGAEIRNKSKRETFPPKFEEIAGARIVTVSFSLYDTTLHFSNGRKVSLKPTQYVIYDPAFGGEAWPQWDEELEAKGIPSMPGEEVTPPAGPDWEKRRAELEDEREQRHRQEAEEFLQEDE